MKIETIDLKNYKAFYGEQIFEIGGKNVFIYGENGSGKSSLYYAVKDFFQSSVENIDLNELENIFIEPADKGGCSIKINFRPDKDGNNAGKVYEFSMARNDTRTAGDASIRDANHLKSFLNYKHLLDIHHVKKNGEINLFDLLVKGVLKHFTYALTGTAELGKLWENIERIIVKGRSRQYNKRKKNAELSAAFQTFNTAFGQLFIAPTAARPNPEYILGHAQPMLEMFENNLGIQLIYKQARPNHNLDKIERAEVEIQLTYGGQTVPKPHLFLNEARLSAIAISIYFGMIKRHPQRRAIKILFLDDIFIGLDMSNRLPLLKIIKTYFSDYQIFITTYDRNWFEIAKNHLDDNWLPIEMYVGENAHPVVLTNQLDAYSKAKSYLSAHDYNAAGNSIRRAVEKRIDYLLPTTYSVNTKDLNDLIEKLFQFYRDSNCSDILTDDLKAQLLLFKDTVFNPASHSDLRSPLYKAEIEQAIEIYEDLLQLPKIERILLLGMKACLTYQNAEREYQARYILRENLYLIRFGNGDYRITDPSHNLVSYSRRNIDFCKGDREEAYSAAEVDNQKKLQMVISKRLARVRYYLGLVPEISYRDLLFDDGGSIGQAIDSILVL